jgi:hypothetical protein
MAFEYTWVALIGGSYLFVFFLWFTRKGIAIKGGWKPLAMMAGAIWFAGLILTYLADEIFTEGVSQFIVGNLGIIIATALPIAMIAAINSGWESWNLDVRIRSLEADMDDVSRTLGFERKKFG